MAYGMNDKIHSNKNIKGDARTSHALCWRYGAVKLQESSEIVMSKTTNELAVFCLEGLNEIQKSDSFDFRNFYPNGEGVAVQEESQGRIDDLALFPEIVSILETTKNKKVYWWVKLILYRLLRNTKNSKIGEYLIEAIKAEKELWKIKYLTGTLSDTGGYTENIADLTYLLEHPSKDVRLNVIQALKFSSSPAIEEPLLSVLDSSNNYYEVLFSLWSIQGVVTNKSLETLNRLLYHKKQDIKISSLSAIASVLQEEGSDFYLNLLNDRNYREKDTVAIYICRYCRAAGVPAICDRVKSILSGKRGRPTVSRREDGTESTYLVRNIEFLSKYYSEFSIIEKVYKVIEMKWDNIHDSERVDIRNAIDSSRHI